jgi:hypothetical protein
MNPIRQRLQRATSLIRIEVAALAISSGPEPLAKAAATIDPALTPVTQCSGMPWGSKIYSTPAWAIPRANPPPSASPMRGTITAGGRGRSCVR